MVSQEFKLNPQDVREWNLTDLTEAVADILNKNDIEACAYYLSK